MRFLLILLVLLGLIGAGGYFTRPGQGLHRGVAVALMEQGTIPRPDQTTGRYAFEDFYVVTRSTMRSGEASLLQCWGVFTRFLCTGPSPSVPASPTAATG